MNMFASHHVRELAPAPRKDKEGDGAAMQTHSIRHIQ